MSALEFGVDTSTLDANISGGDLADAISKACKIENESCHEAFIGDHAKDLDEDEAAVRSSIASRQKYAAGREGRVHFYADDMHKVIKATKGGSDEAIVVSNIGEDLREDAQKNARTLGKIVAVVASLGWVNMPQVGAKAYETKGVYDAAKALLSTLGDITEPALNALRTSFFREAAGRFGALGAGDENVFKTVVARVADAAGMTTTATVAGGSTRSSSGALGASYTQLARRFFPGSSSTTLPA